jgi:hypothetical protein
MSIPDSSILTSVIEHVFMPPMLPQAHSSEEMERETNVALCTSLIDAAQDFLQILPPSQGPMWLHMIKMMELARRAANVPFEENDLQRVLQAMDIGGTYG